MEGTLFGGRKEGERGKEFEVSFSVHVVNVTVKSQSCFRLFKKWSREFPSCFIPLKLNKST